MENKKENIKMMLNETLTFSKISEDDKEMIASDLNLKIGSDINELALAHQVEKDLMDRREYLQSCLSVANSEVPTKLSKAIEKAEQNSEEIKVLKKRRDELKVKVEKFIQKTNPLKAELEKRFSAINKLEGVLGYLKSFEKIEDLSRQLKQCNDDEQAVLLYLELKEMCNEYQKGHRGSYVKEYTHYWHNVLKDKLTKNFEETLTLLKWPVTSGVENSPMPKEVLLKFSNLTKNLFLIQEPEDLISSAVSDQFMQDQEPSLPVRILLRPLKKRFLFHFTGSRQTARIDRPEWFLTQTLTWIKDHQGFVRSHVQPVADKLQMKNVKAVDEFNAGLIALAAERLHSVLALYQSQGSKGEAVDVDAAFAHAVDETLGFHKELVTITGKDSDSVLAVLTKAEAFVKWLAVEKKYALAKMDEALGNEQWCEPVAAGVTSAVGSARWVPRAADWFVSLLATIEERYSVLPQPGHRLQFLELQLELVEEWRVRLTQLLSAAMTSPSPPSPPQPLVAVVNAAHHTRAVLLQWAHSLHYLQLHFYRRQFQQFTNQQHTDDTESMSTDSSDHDSRDGTCDSDAMSLKEVELRAQKLALKEVKRRDSVVTELSSYDLVSAIALLSRPEPGMDDATESAGVWSEAPGLLAHLRDQGLAAVADRILTQFRATLTEYATQKWHGMPIVEERSLCVSPALCAPLSALCARLTRAADSLAPPLAARLRAACANSLDTYLFEEVVLQNWFNTGGTIQLTHDVKRNLIPAFAPPNKSVSQLCQLPKLVDACKLLNLDYEEARRLRAALQRRGSAAETALLNHGVRHVSPAHGLQLLSQRTDLSDASSPHSLMELF